MVKSLVANAAFKTVVYRVYATSITAILSYFIFAPETFTKVRMFAVMDIVCGSLSYYLFEILWAHMRRGSALESTSDRSV
jgi:uncharacterized membrane protein